MRPHVIIPLNVFDHNLDISRDYHLYDELSIKKGIIYYSSWDHSLGGKDFTECWKEEWSPLKGILNISGYKVEIKPMCIVFSDSRVDGFEFLVFENTRHNLELINECVNNI